MCNAGKILALAGLFLVFSEAAAPAGVVNRWQFNNAAGAASGKTLPDSISGAVATVRGNNSAFNGTALVLPGSTNGNKTASTISGYLDLPNGIISSKTNLTVEAWVTPLSSKNWQRIFDFGRANIKSGPGAATGEIIDTTTVPGNFNSYDNLMLTLNIGNTLGQQRLEGRRGGNGAFNADQDNSTTTPRDAKYHYVMTVTDGVGDFGSAGSRMAWYRNGVLQKTVDLDFHLSQISDVNNWIGRSQFGADSNSNFSLDELRIYNNALTPAQVTSSYNNGPNVTFTPPVANGDSATLHLRQKVLIPVLANDTNAFDALTPVIVSPPATGTATVQSDGTILYAQTSGAPATDSFTYRTSNSFGASKVATVTLRFADGLRIANTSLNVPSSPPVDNISILPAFGDLTFDKPLCFASPPGDTRRLFVCELDGVLKVIPDVTSSTPTASVVLNLPSAISTPARTPAETITNGPNGECGLLSVAFHPNYAQNGYFFVTYSVVKAGSGGWFQRLSRFTVPTAQIGQPAPVADPASELILIEQADREDNHNGGDLHFGADGYLYYSIGDEGNPNDHWLNSQRIDKNFFSGLLRIDVDKKSGSLEPNPHASVPRTGGIARYSIPADNPFVGASSFNGLAVTPENVRTEFWATGLRSPWRFSIDQPTGEIWLADVGQDKYEEVNLITKGGNYGWVYREGKHDTAFANPAPPAKPAGFSSIDPVYEYVHNGLEGDPQYKGNSAIGGVVYRGSRIPSLTGAYIFGDQVSGNIWALTRSGGQANVERIGGQEYVATFGTDPSNGDVLLSAYFGGRIMRLTTAPPEGSYPLTLSQTGLFSDLRDLSPAPGLLPYTPNLPFWSDYAIKRRWFIIPDATSKMTWSRDGVWNFPAGEIWVKHFDLETQRGNPQTKRRLETRVLVKNAAGVYGVSYRWNDAQTDATLVADGGETFPVNISVNGAPYTQQWQIPSRSNCLSCHTPQAGGVLSFNTRQMNLTNNVNGFVGNQLDLLHSAGYFSNEPESPNVLPRHVRPDETNYPVEARVRSYLAVNCAYCHQAGGSGRSWDGLPELSLAETGLIHGVASSALREGDQLIVPNSPDHSIVRNRIAVTNGYTRMPPLGTNELDYTNIALVENWISQFNLTHQTYDQWHEAQFGAPTPNEGDENADPDNDAQGNYSEFLAGTNPRDGSSVLRPTVSPTGDSVDLSFSVPQNRSVFVETSTDLVTWRLWDVPGNNGVAQPGGPLLMSGPQEGPNQFFRVQLQEN